MSKLILYPQEIKQLDPEILGGKGANLVRLVITTKAYEEFLIYSGLIEIIEELKSCWSIKGISRCISTIQKVVSFF